MLAVAIVSVCFFLIYIYFFLFILFENHISPCICILYSLYTCFCFILFSKVYIKYYIKCMFCRRLSTKTTEVTRHWWNSPFEHLSISGLFLVSLFNYQHTHTHIHTAHPINIQNYLSIF